jgi:hypothetical protein
LRGGIGLFVNSLELPKRFRCKLFRKSMNSLDMGEYNVDLGRSLAHRCCCLDPFIGKVVGVECLASRESMIVMSSDNEDNTTQCPICLAYDTNSLPVLVSSSTKWRMTKVEQRSGHAMIQTGNSKITRLQRCFKQSWCLIPKAFWWQ